MIKRKIPFIYVYANEFVCRRGSVVYLGQVAQLLTDSAWENKLRHIVLYEPSEMDGNLVLIDMMLVVKKIKEVWPQASIELFGEPHMIVELQSHTKPGHWFLLLAIWVLLFIGSGLAIMNFHADVSMPQVHQKIFTMITSKEDEHPLVLQIPYSIGIGAGMILFFNRLFKKKFNEEPNPLEVEMFMYEESMHQYVVADEYEKKKDRDPL